jgi:hypothetical protein
MRTAGRIVSFSLIYDGLQRALEIKLGQSKHALYQYPNFMTASMPESFFTFRARAAPTYAYGADKGEVGPRHLHNSLSQL